MNKKFFGWRDENGWTAYGPRFKMKWCNGAFCFYTQDRNIVPPIYSTLFKFKIR